MSVVSGEWKKKITLVIKITKRVKAVKRAKNLLFRKILLIF